MTVFNTDFVKLWTMHGDACLLAVKWLVLVCLRDITSQKEPGKCACVVLAQYPLLELLQFKGESVLLGCCKALLLMRLRTEGRR